MTLRALALCTTLVVVLATRVAGQTPGPATEESAPAAVIGDRVVTIGEIDRAWRLAEPAEYASATQRRYDARRRFLNELIAEELIAREAQARGLTVQQLLAEELPRRTYAVLESDIEAMYRALGDQTKGATLDQMRPALRAYLERGRPDLAKTKFVAELMRTSTRVRVLLEPPRIVFDRTDQDAVLGPKDAPVEIVIFGDFSSVAYATTARALPMLRDMYGEKVRLVFKNLPAAGQTVAMAAAVAAQCAKAQDKFWPYHDALLAETTALDADALKRSASTAGLHQRDFETCLESGARRAVIARAVDEASRYGVGGAPRYFVNGRPLPDMPPFQVFKQLVEEELLRTARSASSVGR